MDVDRFNNTVVDEKSIPSTYKDVFGIEEAFAKLGWSSLLNLHGTTYPDLVKQFYANMPPNYPNNGIEISTYVKGVEIKVTHELLQDLFKLPKEGVPVLFYKDGLTYRTAGDPTWSRDAALERFDVPIGKEANGKQVIKLKYFDVTPRLIVYMLQYNVMPRASGFNQGRLTDLYIIDKMMNGLGDIEGIPITHILLSSMWDVALYRKDKCISHTYMITKILRHFKVDFRGEKKSSNSGNVLNKDSLKTLGIELKDGVWVQKNRRTRDMRSESEERMGQGNNEGESSARPRHRGPIVSNAMFQHEMRDKMYQMEADQREIKEEQRKQRVMWETMNNKLDTIIRFNNDSSS